MSETLNTPHELELTAPNGEEYSIELGLPQDQALAVGDGATYYQVPLQPHVFNANVQVVGSSIFEPLLMKLIL